MLKFRKQLSKKYVSRWKKKCKFLCILISQLANKKKIQVKTAHYHLPAPLTLRSLAKRKERRKRKKERKKNTIPLQAIKKNVFFLIKASSSIFPTATDKIYLQKNFVVYNTNLPFCYKLNPIIW